MMHGIHAHERAALTGPCHVRDGISCDMSYNTHLYGDNVARWRSVTENMRLLSSMRNQRVHLFVYAFLPVHTVPNLFASESNFIFEFQNKAKTMHRREEGVRTATT